jgi:hypothetical protein
MICLLPKSVRDKIVHKHGYDRFSAIDRDRFDKALERVQSAKKTTCPNPYDGKAPMPSGAPSSGNACLALAVALTVAAFSGSYRPTRNFCQEAKHKDEIGTGASLAICAIACFVARTCGASLKVSACIAIAVILIARSGAGAVILCKNHHPAKPHILEKTFRCDDCRRSVLRGSVMHGCQECNWDICQACVKRRNTFW